MKLIRILHYLALILGFQASAFFTFFLIADGGIDLLEGKYSVIPIMVMMIFSVGGYIWSMSNLKKGSLMMISGGILMAIYLLFLGGLNEIEMAMIFGLPFVIPGLVFYFTANQFNEPETT